MKALISLVFLGRPLSSVRAAERWKPNVDGAWFARRAGWTRVDSVCHLLGLVLLSAVSAFALDKNPSAFTRTITADRADSIYHRSEPVTFTIAVSLNGQPVNDAKVKWTLSNDGKGIGQNGELNLVNGKGTVTGKLEEAGFLQCRADITPPGEKVKTIRAAAAIDALEIKPSVPAPDDFCACSARWM